MKQKNSYTIYSVADIQKYLEGKLSATEMHAIEKAALEDPMLADAIEGMETGSAYYQEDIRQLRERLFQKRRRSIVIAWSGAAAVVIVLATYGILLLNQRKPVNKPKELATMTIVPKYKEKTIDTVPTVAANKVIASSSTDKSGNQASSAKKKSLPDDVPAQVPLLAEKEKKNSDSEFSVAALPDKQKVSDPLKVLQGRVPGMLIEQTYNKKDTIFRGYVKDNNGVPVVGAQVRISKNKEGTVSDQDGSFTLKAVPGDSSIKVQVSSVGYEPVEKMIALSSLAKNEIVLNPSLSALDEVVIAKGYYAKKAPIKRKEANKNRAKQTMNAEPIDGWKAYNRYLEKQKRKDSADLLTKGRVIIRFDVDSNGNLFNFTIKKSLSPFYDQEAIRLIKEGPGWKLKQGEKESVELPIDF